MGSKSVLGKAKHQFFFEMWCDDEGTKTFLTQVNVFHIKIC